MSIVFNMKHLINVKRDEVHVAKVLDGDIIKKVRCPHVEAANLLYFDIIVNEFKLQLRYYIHFFTQSAGAVEYTDCISAEG